MVDPVTLRRAAGVVLVGVAWLTLAAFLLAVTTGGTGVLFLMVILAAFLVPTLVSLRPLLNVGRDLRAGRHAGDRLLFWSLLYCAGPTFFAFRNPVLWVPIGAVVVALGLYAAGSLSKYDPPG